MLQLIRDFIFPKAYDFSAKPRKRTASAPRPAATERENGDSQGRASDEAGTSTASRN
ncbi:MAG TPA: hypothetical protein VGR37_19650 [Longimicrobiaceae bacterium]|nr:hypothetical protein [Longimicrobiaceae bacterium]